VIPLVVSALVFGAIAVAVRSSGDDDGREQISGPAAQLPAVVTAVQDLLATVPPEPEVATALGTALGDVTLAYSQLDDQAAELEFAEQFRRLPDAEARLLGRTLAAIQVQLSPTAVDGSRGADDRSADILFALQMARAMAKTLNPDGTHREQALELLPFSVQDLTGFDEIADLFASGDLSVLAARIDGALSEAGAAELVSSVANAVSDRLPGDYNTQFLDANSAASG
jgi:hypothetical protein